jgi:seryl-tRNA synthetase
MIEQLKNRVQALKVDMEDLQKKANELEVELKTIMFSIPNILDESVPNGKDENDNVVVKTYLEPKEFSFTPLSH